MSSTLKASAVWKGENGASSLPSISACLAAGVLGFRGDASVGDGDAGDVHGTQTWECFMVNIPIFGLVRPRLPVWPPAS